MDKRLMLCTGLALTSYASTTAAQTVSWGTPAQYDHGDYPAAATNGFGAGDELEIHLGGEDPNGIAKDLWSKVGTWSGGLTTGNRVPSSSPQDYALWQGLAGDGSTQSQVFISVQAWEVTTSLWPVVYRTGYVNTTDNLSWNRDGTTPLPITSGGSNINGAYVSVAQANSQVIEFQNNVTLGYNGGIVNTFSYSTGTLSGDGTTVSWNNQQSFPGEGGFYATIATWGPITGQPGKYFVVELHEDNTSSPNKLWYTTGVLSGGSIAWDSSQVLDPNGGFYPHIAVCQESGQLGSTTSVVEVHNGGTGQGWYRTGRIQSDGHHVTWTNSAIRYDNGSTLDDAPAIACTQGWGFEAHASSGALIRTPFTIQ